MVIRATAEPSVRQHGPLRRLIIRSDGTSVVEYALILALLVAGFITSAWMLGAAPNATFRRLAGDMTGQLQPRTTPANDEQDRPAAQTSNQPADATGGAGYLAGGGATLLAICAALAWLLRNKPRPADEMGGELVEEQLSSNCPRFVEKRQRILRVLTNHSQKLANNQIQVGDLMTTNPLTVAPSASVADLRDLMQQEEIRHVLVCEGSRLLGVVSDRDVRGTSGKTAKQIMSVHPVTIPRCSSILPAVTLMLERHISSLPVMDEDRVVGIITTTDVAMALQCMSQILQQWAAERFAAQEGQTSTSPEPLHVQAG
jgi:predicted transcriptional regulator/Flp pilus assembly pilin Flp